MTMDELIADIDNRITRLMPASEATQPLYGMLRYHLGWADERFNPIRADSGKRVRARLCLLACEAVGGNPERALPAAVAVELIHNFSLIHDDIQDRSEFRRHRRTVWAVWGEAQAINAGDEMFVLAQMALLDNDQGSAGITVRAATALNTACRALCEGQYLDLDFERRARVTLADYHTMILGKTAALLEASCQLGAMYGGAGESAVSALASFGRQLGIAFQIRDDYLGIWGNPEETGKPAADDVISKKKTLPLLYALEASAGSDKNVLEALFSTPGIAGRAQVEQVLGILDRTGAAEHTVAESARYSSLAVDALLSATPESPARSQLAYLCNRLAGRMS